MISSARADDFVNQLIQSYFLKILGPKKKVACIEFVQFLHVLHYVETHTGWW